MAALTAEVPTLVPTFDFCQNFAGNRHTFRAGPLDRPAWAGREMDCASEWETPPAANYAPGGSPLSALHFSAGTTAPGCPASGQSRSAVCGTRPECAPVVEKTVDLFRKRQYTVKNNTAKDKRPLRPTRTALRNRPDMGLWRSSEMSAEGARRAGAETLRQKDRAG